jgi:hypothetical protein
MQPLLVLRVSKKRWGDPRYETLSMFAPDVLAKVLGLEEQLAVCAAVLLNGIDLDAVEALARV